MARLKVLAPEAPIVRFVTAEMAGIGQHLGIGVRRVRMARFKQQDAPRARAQAVGEHTPGRSASNNDDVVMQHLPWLFEVSSPQALGANDLGGKRLPLLPVIQSSDERPRAYTPSEVGNGWDERTRDCPWREHGRPRRGAGPREPLRPCHAGRAR